MSVDSAAESPSRPRVRVAETFSVSRAQLRSGWRRSG